MLDAKLLCEQGRAEGALLPLLAAIAAASRIEFPRGTRSIKTPGKAMGDREAFETYLGVKLPPAMQIGLRGTTDSGFSVQVGDETCLIEQLLYKWFRCSLVHEAKLHDEVEFAFDPANPVVWVQAGGNGNKCKLSVEWINVLRRVLANDPRIAAQLDDLSDLNQCETPAAP